MCGITAMLLPYCGRPLGVGQCLGTLLYKYSMFVFVFHLCIPNYALFVVVLAMV
jgi:hypothetical protein